jgi:glutamate-ammonia-ligase adenylyltransferase
MTEAHPDRAKIDAVRFSDPARAHANLECIERSLGPDLGSMISTLLADLPDPDSALNLLERLSESAGAEVGRLFRRYPSLVHYTLAIFGHSLWLGETLLQNTDLLQSFVREATLDRSHSHEEFREAFARFRSRSFETDIAILLARFKRREYIRILLRDVLGLGTLAETTAEISALSDVLIEEALHDCESEMHRRFEAPQYRDAAHRLVTVPFAVLALGKLGGNELNYSSDVDLLFLYGEGESEDEAPISNREYFVRLGQQVTNVLSRATPEGFVFRIDLRLRPQGREGEAAISIAHARHYYSQSAHDWERQALIKVRPCAGDIRLARRFIRGVQEHVYAEQLNFAAIETAIEARGRLTGGKTTTPRTVGIDVKLDRGGIRDIEFLVQCLQRVYGGKEPWLRSGGTLFSLQKLHDKRHISGSDFQQLTSAYEFLRRVEHRLQLRRGQQTHRVPTDSHEVEILARSLHHSSAEPLTAHGLMGKLRAHMEQVAEIYKRIVHQQQQRSDSHISEAFALQTNEVEFGRVPSDHQLLQRLGSDQPKLYGIATQDGLEPHTRRNLLRFLSSAFTTVERYRAVAAVPEALDRAVELFRLSEFVTDLLVRHPEDLASLSELRTSSTRHQKEALFATEDLVRGGYGSGLEEYLASGTLDRGEKLGLIRRRYRYRLLLSAARDVLEARPVVASLTDTTNAAQEAVAAAWSVAGRSERIAVLALGRLGTLEFDCASDADLLFVRDPHLDAETASRQAEEIVHALSAYTSDGTVMAVDLRLRPHGGEGELMVTPETLREYFSAEAQAWEALTYTKLRHLAGNADLAAQSIAAVAQTSDRFAHDPSFATSVRDMRLKLENSEQGLKTSAGGIYDIDFLAGFLTVKHRVHTAEGTISSRLHKLGQVGLIAKPELQVLLDAMELYRTVEHAIRLVTGRAAKDLPVSEIAHDAVSELVSRTMTRDLTSGLAETLDACRASVRRIFDETLI